MLEVISDTIIDVLKLIPFLFITYLIMEYIEQKSAKENKKGRQMGNSVGKLFRNNPTMWF